MPFLSMDDLKQGKVVTVCFPRRDLSSSQSFLPREEADSIPFSRKELPNLLQRFSFSRNSPQGKAIEDTLRECEAPSWEKNPIQSSVDNSFLKLNSPASKVYYFGCSTGSSSS
ncbi:hypothetical protein CQW23_23475 [Capsicum baccatum]|uniref:BURP domain-containing protein n=1 Tax=Capsicum baccatum TaxID=33114 RepID=A0A2G2VS32_CAPBA|nr:hypothetical protein CQW23_23475 [Capsicum baccatum]